MSRLLLLLAFLTLAPQARAAVFDEFEVHGTDIAPAGAATADAFLSYGLRGFRNPAFHGGLATDRAFYATPLLGYGMTRWWETAVLLPTATDRDGRFRAGGAKFHNVLVLPHAEASAWTFGAVLEASALSPHFQPGTFGWEVRPLAQYRSGPWVANATLGFSGGFNRRNESVLSPALALYRDVSDTLALGLEHYAELGHISHPAAPAHQAHQLFVVAELPLGPFALNLGVGRGLTGVTDNWVVKAHLSYGF